MEMEETKMEPFEFDNSTLDEGCCTGTIKLMVFMICAVIVSAIAVFLVIYFAGKETRFQNSMNINNLMNHLKEFQEIANENGGSRSVNTGFNASADYVVSILQKETNYKIETQVFSLKTYEQSEKPIFRGIDPISTVFKEGVDFLAFSYSGSGDIYGTVQTVDNLGCEASDYTNFVPGNIALVRRGTCSFHNKTKEAVAAQAVALIIYNSGEDDNTGLFTGTLQMPDGASIPVISTTFDLGVTLSSIDDLRVNIFVNGLVQTSYTRNVIAETVEGDSDHVIIIGSHLDSVAAGPGINDDGSGSSLNLELAIQSAKLLKKPRQKIRFAWWGAEELGLLGSTFYVNNLKQNNPDELSKIVLNLNFDMVASPNFERGIYNGTSADLGILKASTKIQKMFEDFFELRNISTIAVPFTGRSDYGPFIDVGIPAGGLFTGAEEIKSDSMRKLFGGVGNTAFDPCYHKACDNIDNINQKVFLENANSAASIVHQLATAKNIKNFLNEGEAERWTAEIREWNDVKDRTHLFYTVK